MARAGVSVLFTASILLRNTLAQTCYFPDGTIATGDRPCNSSAAASTCCGSTYACLSNNVCMMTSLTPDQTGLSTYTRGSCTDSTWTSDSCPLFCIDPTYDLVSGGMGLQKCPDTSQDIYFCIDEQEHNCTTHNNLLTFAGTPTLVYDPTNPTTKATTSTITTSTTTTSSMSTDTTPTTSTTSLPSASSSSNGTQSATASSSSTAATGGTSSGHSSGSSNTLAIGLGVGIPLGVIALALVVYLPLRYKQRQKRNAQQVQHDPNTLPAANMRQSHQPASHDSFQRKEPAGWVEADAAPPTYEVDGQGRRYELGSP